MLFPKLNPHVKDFATVLKGVDDVTFRSLTPQLLEGFYHHKYSAEDISSIIQLNQEINDDSFLSFFQSHPQVIQVMMSLESNRVVIWTWMKNHESLIDQCFENISSFLTDRSPVLSLFLLDW